MSQNSLVATDEAINREGARVTPGTTAGVAETGGAPMTCPRCGAPMTLMQQIEFPQGPAKLVFECAHGHVRIAESPDPPPAG